MKVTKLIEMLKDLPEDFEVCLGKAMAITAENDFYEILLCAPLVGIFTANEDKEVRMLVDYTESTRNFGTAQLFDKEVGEWREGIATGKYGKLSDFGNNFKIGYGKISDWLKKSRR